MALTYVIQPLDFSIHGDLMIEPLGEGDKALVEGGAGVLQLSPKMASIELHKDVTRELMRGITVGDRSWPNLFLAL